MDPDPASIVHRLSRDPTVDAPPDWADGAADEFCRLACLVYSEVDSPERWARARELLAADRGLLEVSIAAAACAADPEAIAAHLAAEPLAARQEVGPHRWSPLMYLTYSRIHSEGEPAERFVRSARLLVDAGANVNAGYLWRGLTPPFTVLTGAFGEGEQGAGRQPRHCQSAALARLLLAAGADPNDGQALYNRMFRPDDDHLQLLFEFGLGRVTGGPWTDLLGDLLEPAATIFARQVGEAIDRGFADRLELLIANGVELDQPLLDGRTAAEHAVAAGYRDIIEDLRVAGVPIAPSSPVHDAVGALLAGDAKFVAAHGDLVADARRSDPSLIHRVRTAAGVALIVGSGFDVDARRGGTTALHEAAFVGDLELITALTAAGADREARDDVHGGTPLAWAEYAFQSAAVELLRA